MGARAWSIEHYVPSTYNGTSASVQTMFWSLYNFFNYASATVGTQIIAYQKGNNTSYPGGGTTGNNRFDQAGYFGSNSFFVVRFNSASIPFEMLFQMRTFGYNSNNTNATFDFGASPGNPGKVEGVTRQAGQLVGGLADENIIGFAVAQRHDGSRSWNGTMLNNGNDTKNTTSVWIPSGSLQSGSFWPRNNNANISGAFQGTRENTMFLTRPLTNNSAPTRWHFYIDTDTFFCTQDWSDDTAYDRVVYFGPYTPFSAANVTPNYLCFCDDQMRSNRQYGYIQGTNPVDATNYPNGGVNHPTALLSGVLNLVFSVPNVYAAAYFPSTFYGNAPRFFPTKFQAYVNDMGIQNIAGQVGTLDKISLIIGPASNDVSGSTAAMGISTTANTLKFVMPWPTGVLPGVSTTPFVGQQITEIF